MMFQNVMERDKCVILETSVKLYGNNDKLIHQKSYIPVINRLGLSREFDMMLLESVMKLCSTFDDSTIFALTLFPSTIRNHTFFEKAQMLFANNVEARGRILFILGENEYYNQIRRYNELLQSYRRMGILIALDRLGIYQTTLLYLKELQVDLVRFDQRYGKQIKEKGYQSLLRGLTISAQQLGVKTWVKMIEDYEAKEIADMVGVDFLQGNYLGKIVPLEVLKKAKDEIR